MRREVILKHLAQSERHIADSDRRIEQQRILVERLDGDGADTVTAKLLLFEFERSLEMHRADRQRLQERLQTAP